MHQTTNDVGRALNALHCIPADVTHDDWARIVPAAKAAGIAKADFLDWAAGAGDGYHAGQAKAEWNSFKDVGGIGAGTLFFMAREHGYSDSGAAPAAKTKKVQKVQTQSVPFVPTPKKGMDAAEVWARLAHVDTTLNHDYVQNKAAVGVPLGDLRVVPKGDGLRIAGHSMAGALVVPVRDVNGVLTSLQFIADDALSARLKADGKPGKLNLPGAPMDGWHVVGEVVPGGVVHIVEGIGAAWSCWQSTGDAAAVCFGSGNMAKVAHQLRAADSAARLVLCPDVGKEADALALAAEIDAAVAAMPEGWPDNSDVNDLAQKDGLDVLEDVLRAAKKPIAEYPLSIVMADDLPSEYEAPDEIVEGLLTAGAGSLVYGDSNSGKTFAVVDMACAVARGVPWLGRRTERGLVVYLAAEGPASVRARLQAYQQHHGVKVPNFAIVQSSIDLFDSDVDALKIIKLVKQLERQTGQKCRLIVGDTLARLSAGANENAGSDMGLVVRRFDAVREATGAHFLLIHHCGKNAASGARGWSGLRAAVDTEVEITDTPAGKCMEITKQRDIPGKGNRIGFRLDVVTLGITKWGEAATSCIVQAADAPAKQGKRMGECDGAVLELLVQHKVGMRKSAVVAHFVGRYEKGPIYRSIKALVTAGAAHEAAGMVAAASCSKPESPPF